MNEENLREFRETYLDGIENFKWYEEVDDIIEKNRFILLMPPPGWGSTTGYTIPYTLMKLAYEKDQEGLILLSSGARASNITKPIKEILNSNSKLIEKYGSAFFTKDCLNHKTAFNLSQKNPMTPTPSLTVIGYNSQIESLRVDWIIIDNPINCQTSKDGVKSIITKLEQDILCRLSPSGKLIMIATRYPHNSSLELLTSMEIFNAPYGKHICISACENGQSTCPERYPIEDLVRMKKKMHEDMWESTYGRRR